MNKGMYIFVLIIIFIIILSSCHNIESEINTVGFTVNSNGNEIYTDRSIYNINDIGGSLYEYSQPCIEKFDSISINLIRLVEEKEFEDWANSLTGFYTDEPLNGLLDYVNIYSFIKHFNIPMNNVKDVITGLKITKDEQNLSYEYLTDEDIEVIYTYDDEKILNHFKSAYSIYNNGKLYTPKWIYNHDEVDYINQEISMENIINTKNAFEKLIENTLTINKIP